jgi:hypothetical protein
MRPPGYETLDYRAPQLERAATIDADIAAKHPHLRETIAASYPGGRELRTLRRSIAYSGDDQATALRRRQLELERLRG